MSEYDPQALREELEMLVRSEVARPMYPPARHLELLTRATIGLIDGQQRLEAKVDRKFAAVDARFVLVDARFDRLEAKVDNLETRFDRLEAKVDNLETRFDKLETRFDKLETRFDRLEREVGLVNDNLRLVMARTEQLVAYIDRKERSAN